MPFIVVTTVRTTKQELPGIIAEVQKYGLDALRGQPGFRSGRLVSAEDETEAATIIEWQSRDAFATYRQSDVGRQVVADLARHHPQISFYEVVAAYDN